MSRVWGTGKRRRRRGEEEEEEEKHVIQGVCYTLRDIFSWNHHYSHLGLILPFSMYM